MTPQADRSDQDVPAAGLAAGALLWTALALPPESAVRAGALETAAGALSSVVPERPAGEAARIAPNGARAAGGETEQGGVLSRMAVMQRLTEDVARAQRYGGGVSVLLCRLGGLQQRRADAGYAAAQAALDTAGTSLRRRLRQMDYVGRYGADTLLVVLPEARADEALDAATRLGRFLSEVDVPASAPRFGAATYPSPPAPVGSADELLSQAEEALQAVEDEPDADMDDSSTTVTAPVHRQTTGGGPASTAIPVRHWVEAINPGTSEAALYRVVCRRCGKVFTVEDRVQQRVRRYCSQTCYKAARRQEEETRNDAIRALRRDGVSLRTIAARYGLTAERVRQICVTTA